VISYEMPGKLKLKNGGMPALYEEGLTAYWTFNEINNWQGMVNNQLTVVPHLQVTQEISYAPLNDWSSLDENSLLMGNGETEIINLIIDASYLELGEQYETNLILQTNDPENTDITISIVVTIVPVAGDENEIITHNILKQNYPNPFYCDQDKRPGAVIKYEISDATETAEIIIYNIRGQKVKTFDLVSGNRGNVIWDGKNSQNKLIGSGVYCYILKTDGKVSCHRKMLLLN